MRGRLGASARREKRPCARPLLLLSSSPPLLLSSCPSTRAQGVLANGASVLRGANGASLEGRRCVCDGRAAAPRES